MSTPFEVVYDVFLSQISDIDLLMNDADNELKYRYLLNSIPRFNQCKFDLSKRTNLEFTESLGDIELLILGNLMVVEYLNPKIVSLKNLQQIMNSRDFSMTSQASHLKQLSDVRNTWKIECDKLMTDYSYNKSDLSRLK
jgi:hypothetical protein